MNIRDVARAQEALFKIKAFETPIIKPNFKPIAYGIEVKGSRQNLD